MYHKHAVLLLGKDVFKTCHGIYIYISKRRSSYTLHKKEGTKMFSCKNRDTVTTICDPSKVTVRLLSKSDYPFFRDPSKVTVRVLL